MARHGGGNIRKKVQFKEATYTDYKTLLPKWHFILRHFTPRHFILIDISSLCHFILWHFTLWHFTPSSLRHFTLSHFTLRHFTLCHFILYHLGWNIVGWIVTPKIEIFKFKTWKKFQVVSTCAKINLWKHPTKNRWTFLIWSCIKQCQVPTADKNCFKHVILQLLHNKESQLTLVN